MKTLHLLLLHVLMLASLHAAAVTTEANRMAELSFEIALPFINKIVRLRMAAGLAYYLYLRKFFIKI